MAFFNLVESFIDCYPVNPAEKFEFGVIVSQMVDHLETNNLSGIRCIIHIPQYAVRRVVNRPLVLADQFGHGPAVAVFTIVYEGSISVLMHNYTPGR